MARSGSTQNQKFGAGVPVAASGNIVRYTEAGERNSLDNGWFTAKLGGPAAGICFGLIVFFESLEDGAL